MQLTPRFLAFATGGECFRKYFTRSTRAGPTAVVVRPRVSFSTLKSRRRFVRQVFDGIRGYQRIPFWVQQVETRRLVEPATPTSGSINNPRR